MPKFFVPPGQADETQIIILGEDAKHLKTVLRAKPGERVTVSNGQCLDYEGEICSVETGRIILKTLSVSPCLAEPDYAVTLFQGLPKGDKMELVIQKCVELGVKRIVPVATERAVMRLSGKEEKKRERYQKIAYAAAKQSGRGIIPEIGPVSTFAEAVNEAAGLNLSIFFYEEERDVCLKEALHAYTGKSIGIFIGPEGGFSEKEAQQIKQAGIPSCTLGKRILRTETAGMAAIAILLYELEQGR